MRRLRSTIVQAFRWLLRLLPRAGEAWRSAFNREGRAQAQELIAWLHGRQLEREMGSSAFWKLVQFIAAVFPTLGPEFVAAVNAIVAVFQGSPGLTAAQALSQAAANLNVAASADQAGEALPDVGASVSAGIESPSGAKTTAEPAAPTHQQG